MTPNSHPLREKMFLESRALVKLGSPILVVQLLQVAVVTVDTIMAGRYNAIDLSGVAIGGSIWFPVFLFLFGLLSALTPTVAQLHGGKDYTAIPHKVYQGIWLALLITPVPMSLMVFLGSLLAAIGAEASIRPITVGYLTAMAVGLPPLLIYNVLRFYSDGVSLTRPAVVASLIGLLVNIPLNHVLINGKFGLPELGGIGCGWASAISFYIMCLYMLGVVACKKAYRAFFLFNRCYKPDASGLKNLLKIGLPIGLAHFVESSMFGIIALFLAPLGPVTVAAHQIALNVSALIFMIPLGLSTALTIRIGYLIGAGAKRDARFTAFFGLALAVAYALLSASVLLICKRDIALLYNREIEVVGLASTLLIYAAAFQLGDALQVTAAGAMRGYKDTSAAMYIMLLTFWCFGLPLGYMLGLSDMVGQPRHAEGFWAGLVLGLLAAGALLVSRLLLVSARFAGQVDSSLGSGAANN